MVSEVACVNAYILERRNRRQKPRNGFTAAAICTTTQRGRRKELAAVRAEVPALLDGHRDSPGTTARGHEDSATAHSFDEDSGRTLLRAQRQFFLRSQRI